MRPRQDHVCGGHLPPPRSVLTAIRCRTTQQQQCCCVGHLLTGMSQNVLVLVNIIFFHAWGSNWATTLTSALPSTVVDSCQPSTTNKNPGPLSLSGYINFPFPRVLMPLLLRKRTRGMRTLKLRPKHLRELPRTSPPQRSKTAVSN